jgi:uncharacterized protein YktA (UPF0223 family)
MKIKSAKSFRLWYKTKVKEIEENNLSYNENFVGTYHSENGKKTKGFFEMYHGDKPDIASYLPSILKIAEDGQAIYEFLQNAVDCNSTHFYIFYSEKYFLAINNGEPFDIEGLQSVLNIAQTTKKSCDKIGRFGIGFKLVHRLVGKNEGVSELVNQYKGPILFSWAKLQDLQRLMEKQPLEPLLPNKENYQEFINAPYLLKLILTNFPAEPNETVKDLHYKDRVVFSQEELNELIDFLNVSFQQHTENININDLKQGSIFFLRLGEGKKEMLDRDYEDLKQGVQYSMNTLKKLKSVYLNNEFIAKQALDLEEFEIEIGSEDFEKINPEYKECNIKVSFGYYHNYQQSEKIKASPNFYKYFPMGDETNGFSFIIHCDSFSNEANRRKLQKDSINKNLLPVIANFIIKRLDEYKINDREQFLRLYACLLLSDVPDKQNNEWLKSIFYDVLLEYLCSNVPTKNNKFSDELENVKINKLKIDINLSDFGLEHIQWFEWESNNDSELVKEAKTKEKLDLEVWHLEDLILSGRIEKINSWLHTISNEFFNEFVLELRNISEASWERKEKELFKKFCKIEYFKFSDNNFLSITGHQNYPNVLILNPQLFEIKDILLNLDFVVTERVVTNGEKSSYLSKLIHDEIDYLRNGTILFEKINASKNKNKLNPKDKKRLFEFLEKLEGIGKATLGELELFCSCEGEMKPLNELVDSTLITPIWLNTFKIKAEENFTGLKKYLIFEKELYREIILQNWDDIISEVTNVVEFYQKVKLYYDQDDKNTPLKKQSFIFINEAEGFVSANEVFYNSKFSQVTNYKDFQNAILKLTDTQTPQKQIFNYLKEAPFEVKNSNLLDFSIKDNTELSLDEVKAVLAFSKSNNENFFQKCTIEKQDKTYYVSSKTKGIFQVFPNKESRNFIVNNLINTFKILPYELDEYKNEAGVLYREPFYNQLIESIDVDDYKTELIDFIVYDEPKRKFILALSEIRFVLHKEYDKESFEYKILALACDSKIIGEADYSTFKEKIIIETDDVNLSLTEIPPFADKIKIEGLELSLAKILPNNYQNSNYLGDLIAHFVSQGLSKERINDIFGISQEPDLEDIFEIFSEQTETLENAEQLAFLFLYGLHIDEIDFSEFQVLNINEEEVSLKHDKYINGFDFVDTSQVLHKKYKGITKYFDTFPIIVDNADNLLIIKKPYFESNKFKCHYLLKELSDEQKISLVEFLFNQWDKKSNKTVIQNIDWTIINDIETIKLLGFNPKYSVYPSEHALESEVLPDYLQKWIDNDSAKISFLTDLGVWTENSTLVGLRKFFANQGAFNKNKIIQESRFSDETMLFNTFEWLQLKELELENDDEYDVFQKMVEVINDNREKGGKLIIEEEYDLELLENEATEWEASYYESWKEDLDDKFAIYLFEGALPLTIKLDEIEDYVFYRINQGDILIDEKNNIYIKRNADIETTLSSLISEKNEFSTEDLLLLYQTKETVQIVNDEVAELKSEVERLRQVIESLTRTSGTATYNATVSFDNEYHNEIKEKSEVYLFDILEKAYPSKIVKWLNFNAETEIFEESWQNHDFEILNKDGTVLHYIDCKGTPQQKKTFYLTSNEWAFFLDCVKKETSYQIYRVFNVDGKTDYIHIENLWKWIKKGKVVPYLSATETIKGGRVFLTLV